VSISPGEFAESAGAGAATGTVTRSGGDQTQPLTVSLSSSDTTELTVPASVTIPAGVASATFPVAAVNDTLRDGPQAAAVTAAARVDGSPDPLAGFVAQGQITSYIPAGVAALSDGRWIVAGNTRYDSSSDNTYDVFVSRRLADGSPDLAFGTADGTARTDVNGHGEQTYGVLVQPDGKILVLAYGNVYGGSSSSDVVLLRYSADGALDPTFGSGGVALLATRQAQVFRFVRDFTLQPDGKIVVVGTGESTWANSNDFAVARFNADGSVDTGFGTNGYRVADAGALEDAYGVALQSDGKIVVAGQAGNLDYAMLARYTTAGALDTSFGNGGFLTADLNPFGGREDFTALTIDSQDRITTYGNMLIAGQGNQMVLSRYLADGTLDRTFAGGGHYFGYNKYTGGVVNGLVQLPDGRLVATLSASGYYGPAGVAVFSADGVLIDDALNPNNNVGNGPIAVGPTGIVAGVVDWYASATGWMNRYQLAPAAAAATASAQVTVTDDEPIYISLTVAPTSFPE
jgi:uncharacterized delta-60 repeat protein